MIMGRSLPRRVFIPMAGWLLASCSSPSPALYTLEAPPGPVRRGGPRVIELRSIGLARYLERSQIVRSSENFRLDVLPNDWWGEPLDTLIGRTLARALTQRLPGSTVYSENGAISADPDATVQVNVQRLDQDSTGSVRLIAQFAVIRRATDTRGVTLEVPVRGPATADLVAAMSEAIGQLADRIAASLAA
jgi:uncharacterized lipoprotein YmbA